MVAQLAFSGAILATIAGLGLAVFEPQSEWALGVSALALTLATLSAMVRAIRSGLGLEQLIESYSDYAVQMSKLNDRLRVETASESDRFQALCEVEVAAAQELRRFLRVVLASRYVL